MIELVKIRLVDGVVCVSIIFRYMYMIENVKSYMLDCSNFFFVMIVCRNVLFMFESFIIKKMNVFVFKGKW